MNPAFMPILYDVSALTALDPASLDALANAQLIARRLGTSILLANASTEVCDLLTALGLAEVLPMRSGVEVDRQAEEREEVGIDEVVDRGDATL